MNKSKQSITITIDNLTDAQKIAIEDLLHTWQWMGGIGKSRWTCFFADGDGDFRPEIKINGNPPQATKLINRKQLWNDDEEYRIDQDMISAAKRKVLTNVEYDH